jgi:glycosyltransferase involved in cell wall biosynthesis
MIQKSECGYAVEPDNAELFADALTDAASHPEKLKQMGERAQNLGLTKFDRKKLAAEFVTWLEKTAVM